MENRLVRILNVSIENFKNTYRGEIKLSNINGSKKSSDIIGIYGQNGSGKTSIITAVSLIKKIISGKSLDNDIFKYMMSDELETKIAVKFFVEAKRKKYEVEYSVKIIKKLQDNEIIPVIENEALVYWDIDSNNNRRKSLIINDSSDNIIKPLYRYKEIVEKFDNVNDFIVDKKIAYRERKSFIFSRIPFVSIDSLPDEYEIIGTLKWYVMANLFIVENEMLALSDANLVLPIGIRSYDRRESGVISIGLDKPNSIPISLFESVEKSLKSSNKVMEKLVPGLKIELRMLNRSLNENGSEMIDVELLSIRGKSEIPIRYESDGIKKIVSIINLLIGVYNYRTLTVLVDEIDSGIFEYLLGEIIEILSEGAKGQLIFTSHNLRPLEILNNYNLVFTTSNPYNRYIRLKNVNANNNIRDMYYRTILLDGQDEKLYDDTSQVKIKRAFEKAGEML